MMRNQPLITLAVPIKVPERLSLRAEQPQLTRNSGIILPGANQPQATAEAKLNSESLLLGVNPPPAALKSGINLLGIDQPQNTAETNL